MSEFYRLADLHPDGLLSHAGSAAELLALSGISDAYKRISGEYAREDKYAEQQTRRRERSIGKDESIKEIVNAALPLLVGGAAGVGVGAASGLSLQAVIAGVVAAIGSALVVKMTTTRTTSRSRVENFIFDLSLATLDRILPVLIERLWRAGPAPMFVVDELDKVEDLPDRMRDVVHHLKKLVAESAFFCFLADRKYFEDMLDQTSNRAYPQEYTYYSHRLFVTFQASDFADYLDAKLQITEAPQEPMSSLGSARPGTPPPGSISPQTSTPYSPAPVDSATAPAQTQAHASVDVHAALARGQREKDDMLVRDILMWVLRHRSQLHPLDLRRHLSALSDEDSNVTVPAGDVLRTAYLIDVTMQVLIEALLASADVVQKISNNYESLRVIHDALYFITREWLRGSPTLDAGESGRQAFLDYLEARTGREPKKPHGDNQDGASSSGRTANKNIKNGSKKKSQKKGGKKHTKGLNEHAVATTNHASLSTYDTDFLFELVGKLAAALADESTAKKLIDEWQSPLEPARRPKKPLAGTVRNAMLLDATRSVLVSKTTNGAAGETASGVIYEWRYDPSGRVRIRSAAPAAVVPSPTIIAGAAAKDTVSGLVKGATPGDQRKEPPLQPAAAESAANAWSQRWAEIQELAAKLHLAIGSTPEAQYLRFDALARQFGLIPSRPPWEEVAEAHRRLERGGQSEAGVATDTKLLDDFLRVLQSKQEVIVRALACAAAIGAGSDVSLPSDRVVLGLDVLARFLRLPEKSEEDVASALAAVERGLKKRFAVLDAAGKVPMPPATFASLETALPEFVKNVKGEVPVNAENWRELLGLAWDGAFQREIVLYADNALVDPEVPELLCACRRVGPSLVLKPDSRQMTAAEWSAALVNAVEHPQRSEKIALSEVPAWIGLSAMRELGFSASPSNIQRVRKLLGVSAGRERQSAEEAFFQALVSTRALDTALIVVRRADSSLTIPWRAQPTRYACLVATSHDVQLLLDREFPLEQLSRLRRRVIAIEMDATAGEVPPAEGPPVLQNLRSLLPESRHVLFYGQEPPKRPVGRVVIAPSRPEDLLAADHRQAS